MMLRTSVVVFAALASACATRAARAPYEETTTTTAVITAAGSSEARVRSETSNEPGPQSGTSAVTEPAPPDFSPTAEAPARPDNIAPPSRSLDDSHILGITNTFAHAQMEQARVALARSSDFRVKDLAQLLYDHHHEAQLRVRMLASSRNITTAPSTDARLEGAFRDGLVMLGGRSLRVDFDKAYVQLQARESKELLDLIDAQLIGAARDGDLKKWLLSLRATVAEDWQRAYDLSLTLSK